jgi:hypothetical protein
MSAVVDGGEPYPFDWTRIAGQPVNPLRLAAIEAFRQIGQPLSMHDLFEVFDQDVCLSLLTYQVNVLVGYGALEVVGDESAGALRQALYFFTADPE